MNLKIFRILEIRQRQLFYEGFTLILFLIFSFFPAILYFDRAHVGDTWARYRSRARHELGNLNTNTHCDDWHARPENWHQPRVTQSFLQPGIYLERNLVRSGTSHRELYCLSREELFLFDKTSMFHFGTLNFYHNAYSKPNCHWSKNLPLKKSLRNQKSCQKHSV